MDAVMLEVLKVRETALRILNLLFETGYWNPTLKSALNILRSISFQLQCRYIKPEMILSIRKIELANNQLHVQWSYDTSTILKLVEYFSTL